MLEVIQSNQAPKAIGPYSLAIKAGNTIYISGQLGIDPQTMNLVSDQMLEQASQVFKNLKIAVEAAGCTFANIAKLTIYLTDLAEFSLLNDIMQNYFVAPYPARTTIQVSALPKDAKIEIDAIVILA